MGVARVSSALYSHLGDLDLGLKGEEGICELLSLSERRLDDLSLGQRLRLPIADFRNISQGNPRRGSPSSWRCC
jgi:hypothetical protein